MAVTDYAGMVYKVEQSEAMDWQDSPANANGHGRKRKERDNDAEERSTKKGRTSEVCNGSVGSSTRILDCDRKFCSNMPVIPLSDEKSGDSCEESETKRLVCTGGFVTENRPSRIFSAYEITDGIVNSHHSFQERLPRLPQHQESAFHMDHGSSCDRKEERRHYDKQEGIGDRGGDEYHEAHHGTDHRRNGLTDKYKPQPRSDISLPNSLYGDCVTMASGFVVVSDLSVNLYNVLQEYDHPKRHVAPYVYAMANIPTIVYYPVWAYWFLNRGEKDRDLRVFASRVAFLGGILSSALMNFADWPHTGECTITTMFQGGAVMGVLANVSLSFREKIIRLISLFVLGSIVSIQSPHSVYTEDTLPFLGGPLLVAAFGLYCVQYGVNRGVATVLLSRLCLAAIYTHHTIGALSSIDLTHGFSTYENIEITVKAGIIACVGTIATGIFQKEIWHKEQLEVLVRDRTNELLEQNEQLDMVNMALQATETAIAITEETGRIIWFNSAFRRMDNNQNSANGDGRLVGRPLKDVIYNIDPTTKTKKYLLLEALENIANEPGGFPMTLEQEEEIQIGPSTFKLEATPFRYNCNVHSRDNLRAMVVFKDVTEAQARERAEKTAKEEAMMVQAMGDSMVTLTHELRTPLQGIMGITSILLEGQEMSDDGLESLKLIMASSGLLLNLINNLLDVKKATSKMLEEFPLASVHASGPIKDSVDFCQPLAHISKVKIVTDISNAPGALVHSNALRLQQVLINLVSNAIKYTDKGSEITVSIKESTVSDARSRINSAIARSTMKGENRTDGAVLIFSVSDSGPGIAPEQADRLFRRFAQLDTKPNRTLGASKIGQPSGTGLGLHLCELFVNRMHGDIWATNNNGKKGCTLSFSLPLLSSSKSKPATRKRRNILPRSLLPGNHRLGQTQEIKQLVNEFRVLLVDDTLINRKVISRILKKTGFASVTSVDSGSNALSELSRAKNYDLVVTDLQMPGMSGVELTEAIFDSSPSDFEQPIVIGITADTSIETATRCRDSGMSDLLYKPITIEELKTYVTAKLPKMRSRIWFEEKEDSD